MKKLLILFALLFTLIGCGGGGDSTDTSSFDGSFPTDSYSGTSYDMWDYVVPSTTTSTSSIASTSIEGTYTASFRTLDKNTVEETPQDVNGEKVIYTRNDDNISISFYKDEKKYFSYALKTTVKIGEETTKNPSACLLVDHYPIYNGYSDVIEIDCGKNNKGFYAKGKGEIAKE